MQLDNNDVKQLLAILQQLVEKVSVTNASDATATESQESKPQKKKRGRKPKPQIEAIENTEQHQADDDSPEDYILNPKIKTKNINIKKNAHNKFEQMPEYRMHKEDTVIDKKLNISPPSQRNRVYQPVNVRCRVCGKTESVNPSLIDSSERYKCNRCAASAG